MSTLKNCLFILLSLLFLSVAMVAKSDGVGEKILDCSSISSKNIYTPIKCMYSRAEDGSIKKETKTVGPAVDISDLKERFPRLQNRYFFEAGSKVEYIFSEKYVKFEILPKPISQKHTFTLSYEDGEFFVSDDLGDEVVNYPIIISIGLIFIFCATCASAVPTQSNINFNECAAFILIALIIGVGFGALTHSEGGLVMGSFAGFMMGSVVTFYIKRPTWLCVVILLTAGIATGTAGLVAGIHGIFHPTFIQLITFYFAAVLLMLVIFSMRKNCVNKQLQT